MQAGADAEWPSVWYLEDKFALHHWDVGVQTIEEYDASARATIEHGQRFEYHDRKAGETRVGYWDAEAGLFTALRADERRLITHFRPDDPDYPLGLPGSTYRP